MFVEGSKIEAQAAGDGVSRKVLAHAGSLMLTENSFTKGATGPLHSHPHEQVSYITSGRFSFTLGGELRTVETGDSLYVPGGVEHGCTALEDGSIIIDAFTPIREDFLS